MKKLIAVWFITSGGEVLLKIKKIGTKEFLLPIEAWQKRGESNFGTINRIVKEIEPFTPPQKFKIKFTILKEIEMDTKFGKVKKVYYVCHLPFEPIIEKDSEVKIVGKEKLLTLRKRILPEEYSLILQTLGIQKNLTDFL